MTLATQTPFSGPLAAGARAASAADLLRPSDLEAGMGEFIASIVAEGSFSSISAPDFAALLSLSDPVRALGVTAVEAFQIDSRGFLMTATDQGVLTCFEILPDASLVQLSQLKCAPAFLFSQGIELSVDLQQDAIELSIQGTGAGLLTATLDYGVIGGLVVAAKPAAAGFFASPVAAPSHAVDLPGFDPDPGTFEFEAPDEDAAPEIDLALLPSTVPLPELAAFDADALLDPAAPDPAPGQIDEDLGF